MHNARKAILAIDVIELNLGAKLREAFDRFREEHENPLSDYEALAYIVKTWLSENQYFARED